ncbi:hypothetical protein GGX14DRAFT_574639 [Mycena pura]|uniref:Uncharacterized protein n=1 Tax=Mycena pura TaxID=153505 RepID=A0AAD6Y8X4_9AGAR|nr:hypothetical protein GGX14DRAFT_575267 [Mycena pura]KAJ7196824.1 hypothetical protein GGX14DRAFT_574639 [Mycena pura]
MPGPNTPKPTKASPKKHKTKVNFGANRSGKRKASPIADSATGTSSKKKARMDGGASGSTSTGASASTGATDAGGAESTDTSGRAAGATNTDTNDATPAEKTPAKKRGRNPHGIRPKEVPENAKSTQRALQRVIRAMSGLLTQADVLPSATEARNHYDKRFDDVDDYRAHMRTLVDESRTAVRAGSDLATRLIRDAKRISGPIANDIARIPEAHLATVFTMVLKAGLKGFCPDLEGPAYSAYNQLHRHLTVSAFQFLSASFALSALDVNNKVTEDTILMCDMYDNYVYGTLAQKARMERRRPGSLAQSLKHGAEYKARTRVAKVRFETAVRLELRKPVKRMAYIAEVHSDDEHSAGGEVRRVREKPGRNPVVARFFREELDPEAEAYRKRNAKRGQKEPKTRIRTDPPLPASEIGVNLPPDVPVDFFTPEFYNALSLKERARYVNTGVAFPLEEFAFDKAHDGWKTMGKVEFMAKYGNDVLTQYDIPTPEEMDGLPDSDIDDEEDVEINLEDTDDDEDEAREEMQVDEELSEV